MAALIPFALASIAFAGPLAKRISYTTNCDASRGPNWGDCQGAFDQINAMTGGDPNYFWNPPNNPVQNSFVYNSGSCAVAIVFDSKIGFNNYYVVDAIDDLKSTCELYASGGTARYSDPSFTMSVGIYNNRQSLSKRGGEEQLDKRASGWVTAYTIDNASPDIYWLQIQDGLPAGGEWELGESDTRSTTLEATVEISADLFGLFSASVSTSYSYGQEYTTTANEKIPNNCDGQGTLFFAPRFTQYHGGFTDGSPDQQGIDIYIPGANSDGSAAGEYHVRCSAN